MEKLNLSDNGAGSKRKRGRKQESPSGSQGGSPDDFDDNRSATSARSKVSSLHKSKSITKKKGQASTGPAVAVALQTAPSTVLSGDIFNNGASC